MGKPKTLNPVDQFLGWPAKLAAAKQGDRRAVYAEYLESTVWQGKRVGALERAGDRCQVCNSDKQLNVHHRTYERVGDEAPEDLTVLCRSCHETHHGIGEPSKRSKVRPLRTRPEYSACTACGRNWTTKGLCKPCRKGKKTSSTKIQNPTRDEVRSVVCPTCQARKGESCKLRKANHIARVKRYKEIASRVAL